ncbi:hypothetical protein CMI38_06100 [Candidatus Pacearchaeota archaeon]|jgi:hypothetical protein|nr:hypothetical protein [Candidatus Pacearchaeota archaeon]|tara:strand:- start:99 stop:377 length:279 start_codon:yes stop_codon:yes gene_type:complete
MAIIDLGNGNVIKNGVFFENAPTYKTKDLYDKETGKKIGSEMKHCEKPYYPAMTEADHELEEQMELCSEQEAFELGMQYAEDVIEAEEMDEQ